MNLEEQVIDKMKIAMKSKDTVALSALRALKSAFLLAKTATGADNKLSEEVALKIIQKQVKQRKDSAIVYSEQGRDDLVQPELAEAEVLEQFLPTALSEKEIEQEVTHTIQAIGAEGMQNMGKVMGIVSKKLAGRADGKIIASIVREKLS